MKRKLKGILSMCAVLLCLLMFGCKKSSDEKFPDLKAVKQEHGVPQGSAVTKTIGAAGGSIASADGRMSVTIPAGTVDANTVFSIQPVSSTLSLGTGLSYRLLPENVTFNKEVQVSFNYTDEDLAGTDPDYLFLAYQDAEGYWYRAGKLTRDKTAKRLTVSTKHFSDWNVETSIAIKNLGKSVLTNGESTQFVVQLDPAIGEGIEDPTNDDLLAPVYTIANSNIKEWKVFGTGTITKAHTLEAKYTAPANIAGSSPVTIEATIEKILGQDPAKYGYTGTLIIRTTIQLEKDEYFYWSLKGAKYEGGTVVAQVGNGSIAIASSNGTNSLAIQTKGMYVGSYSSGEMDQSGKVAVVANSNGKAYINRYTKCGDNKTEFGQGSVSITKLGNVGEYVEGTVAMGTWHVDGCNSESGLVQASFRIKRKS